MVSTGDINPFGSIDIGLGAIGSALLIFFLIIFIILLVGGLVIWRINAKKYKYRIPLQKKVGNIVIRVGTYVAKDFPIGRAGDKLWLVKLKGAKKYIPPATLQTAPFEYTHFEREDGEWINISMPDVDEIMKKHKVKYVHQDMRANRVAINTLLDQRFTDKSFWDKYGNMIVNIIMYLVITVCMVIIFWQWSDIVDKTSQLLQQIIDYDKAKSIIPALTLLFFRRRK
jgi:hypothetical protein|tara:strand:- start:2433 stop:3113 length:681 start_codon:yes stop_codon:yes gene_type:complete